MNVSSFRLIIGFAMSFDATTWVENLGFLRSFSIYAGALGIASLGLPFVYFYGKRIRAFTAGTLHRVSVSDTEAADAVDEPKTPRWGISEEPPRESYSEEAEDSGLRGLEPYAFLAI